MGYICTCSSIDMHHSHKLYHPHTHNPHTHHPHTSTILTPTPSSHLHHPHTCTILTLAPSSHLHHPHTHHHHLHHPHTFTILTPTPSSHLHRVCRHSGIPLSGGGEERGIHESRGRVGVRCHPVHPTSGLPSVLGRGAEEAVPTDQARQI